MKTTKQSVLDLTRKVEELILWTIRYNSLLCPIPTRKKNASGLSLVKALDFVFCAIVQSWKCEIIKVPLIVSRVHTPTSE